MGGDTKGTDLRGQFADRTAGRVDLRGGGVMGTPPPTPVELLEARIDAIEQTVHRIQGQADMLEQLIRAALLARRNTA